MHYKLLFATVDNLSAGEAVSPRYLQAYCISIVVLDVSDFVWIPLPFQMPLADVRHTHCLQTNWLLARSYQQCCDVTAVRQEG